MSTSNHDKSLPGSPEELNLPNHIDRRSFLMRNAVIGAAVTGKYDGAKESVQ